MPVIDQMVGKETMFNKTDGSIIDFLLSRRSTLAREMLEPGPDRDALVQILTAAVRVPDHGKLAPWRFEIFTGDKRQELGNIIADSLRREEGINDMTHKALKNFPLQAPVIVGVVSKVRPDHKVPLWEQYLSAGAACQNMILAATSLGFAAQWLTGRGAYSPGVQRYFGLEGSDQIAGFVFIGTKNDSPLKERPRPELDDIINWR